MFVNVSRHSRALSHSVHEEPGEGQGARVVRMCSAVLQFPQSSLGHESAVF